MENTTSKKKIHKNIITGSQSVVYSLKAEGVDLIYGYPGGAIMPN